MAEEGSKSGPSVLPFQDTPEELVNFGSLELEERSVPLEPVVLGIQDLPEEVRGKIFNYVPQWEILSVRLVCKQWERDVKSYYLYRVHFLNEVSPKFSHQVAERICHLNIRNLVSNSVLKPDGTSIFGYPGLITSLIVWCSSYRVSPSNLQSLLGLLSKSLRSLEVSFYGQMDSEQFTPGLSYDFQVLTQLKIFSYGSLPAGLKDVPSFFRVLENSKLPKLRGLKFHCVAHNGGVYVKSLLLGSLMRLVGTNGEFLESFHLSIADDSPLFPEFLRLAESDLARLKSLTRLTKFSC